MSRENPHIRVVADGTFLNPAGTKEIRKAKIILRVRERWGTDGALENRLVVKEELPYPSDVEDGDYRLKYSLDNIDHTVNRRVTNGRLVAI
jgi:hypothetical protein